MNDLHGGSGLVIRIGQIDVLARCIVCHSLPCLKKPCFSRHANRSVGGCHSVSISMSQHKSSRSACTACHERKIKCLPDPASLDAPCQSCRSTSRPCEYVATRRPGRPRNRSKIFSLTDQCAEVGSSHATSATSYTSNSTAATDSIANSINWQDLEGWQGLEGGTFEHLLTYSASQEEMPSIGKSLAKNPNTNAVTFTMTDGISTSLPHNNVSLSNLGHHAEELDLRAETNSNILFSANAQSTGAIDNNRMDMLTRPSSSTASLTSIRTPITPAGPSTTMFPAPKREQISFDSLTKMCGDLQELQKKLEGNP